MMMKMKNETFGERVEEKENRKVNSGMYPL